ncbi:hypothetical protein HYU93_00470 [Candidatus Daviesbacteria bacterium]|nr:hypothetical protein [Candidatus Daviesbacteria bacterium]
MLKAKLVAFFLSAVALFLTAYSVSAGGGPIEFQVEPKGSLNPGEQYVVNVRVYADGQYPTYCKSCYLKLGFMNPQDGDYVAQSSDTTDQEGRLYAKVISKVGGTRTIYAIELKDADGSRITANSTVDLRYSSTNPTSAPVTPLDPPQMVYPADKQELDLEGAYMFKVKPVKGATGYLFGLFQDGVMVYENWRDSKTLSSGGEFALWENNPFHAKFHNGEVKVMIRAYINNQWTNARETTIILRPRGGNTTTSTDKPFLWLLSQQFVAPFGRQVTIKFGWPNGADGNARYNVFVKKTGGSGWEKQLTEEWGPSAKISIRSDEEYYVKVQGCKNQTTNCADSPELYLPILATKSEKVIDQSTSAQQTTVNPSDKSSQKALALPAFEPSQQVMVITDSSAGAALQQRIEELEGKLQQSQQRQSALEKQLNQILSWIRSIFPFFK